MAEEVSGTETREPVDAEALRKLADLNGVATSFWGFGGELQEVSEDSLLRVLAAMGVPVMPGCSNEAIRLATRHSEDLPWTRTLPVCTVVREGESKDIAVHLNDGERVTAWCVLEDGTGESGCRK